jgi:hypothetical protein
LLMKLYLRLSLVAFHDGAMLDQMAAPIQAMNIPIICQDVPHIPLDSDWRPDGSLKSAEDQKRVTNQSR